MKNSIFAILFLIAFSFSQKVQAQETVEGSFTFDGVERDYLLFIPSGYTNVESVSLVFNLHGYTSNAPQQELYSGMNDVAEAENFLICYPNGVGNAWNVGWAFGSTEDDVGFISELIDSLSANYSVDPERVYSCGMSNGGFMSYRLACELNDRIAAVASVTGSMAPQYFPLCDPGQSVPVMEIHGTSDFVVPYGGSAFLAEPIEEVVNFWAENNGCETMPDTTEIADINTDDSSTATRFDYTECDDSKVSFIKITGGGHTWPGAFPAAINGATNQDFNASEAIWEFFKACAPEVPSAVQKVDKEQGIVFPNPVRDVLHFRSANGEAFERCEIFDRIGRQVSSCKLDTTGITNRSSIEVSGLNVGVYVLVLFRGEETERFAFVKG